MRSMVRQCKSCPWRVDCVPDRDIPSYSRELHKGLARTIAGDLELRPGGLPCMACHYSKPGEDFPCAGWLHNQIGIGNNLGVRLAMISGQLPKPEIDGEQHELFEDTMSKDSPTAAPASTGATASTKAPASTESPGPSLTPTLPQTICLLALASGEQPRLLPPITRARLITYRWIVLVERRQPGSKGKTRYDITAAGREALERSKYLDDAKRKIERGKQEVPW